MSISSGRRTARGSLLTGGLALALAVGPLGAPAPASAQEGAAGEDERPTFVAPETGPVLKEAVGGKRAVRRLGDRLAEVAAAHDRTPAQLRAALLSDRTLTVDRGGRLFYRDPAPTGDVPSRSEERAWVAARQVAPLSQTFSLHSNPGADLTIFLDVDGATVADTYWNVDNGLADGDHPAWDPAGDGPTFSDAELEIVQAVYAAVAEDFAPFDVDVTTEDPGFAGIDRSGAADGVYGTRALISPSDAALNAICGGGCGGVAYLDVFDQYPGNGSDPSQHGDYQPAWVFPQALSDNARWVAEATTHEVGHNLSLSHDGRDGEAYYDGHNGWAPIMGVGYDQPISQWSDGSYSGATNTEDDVAEIEDRLGLRPDEAGSTLAGAGDLPDATAYVTSRDDVDVFLLGSCAGSTSVTVTPAPTAPNLDVRAALLDATGAEVASADPPSTRLSAYDASGLDATVTADLAAGTYYLSVQGVGAGSPSTSYDDYGSLGAYTVSTNPCSAVEGTPSAPQSVAATADPVDPTVTVSWQPPADSGDSAVTGYVVTRDGGEPLVLGAAAREQVFTGLDPATTYSFTVAATNAQGRGPSTSVTATTAAATGPPSAVRDLTGLYNAVRDQIEVSWTEPLEEGASEVVGYDLSINGTVIGRSGPEDTDVLITGTFSPGATYTIGVAAANDEGVGPFSFVDVVVPSGDAPDNDDFADATVLSGATGAVGGDNTFATGQAGDPTPPGAAFGAGDRSVWFRWTPSGDGTATFDTLASPESRDTTLAAYTGAALGGLTEVAAMDDLGGGDARSRISFAVDGGTTYHVVVDGFSEFASGSGPYTLTWDADLVDEPTPLPTTTVLTGSLQGEASDRAVLDVVVTPDDDSLGAPSGEVVLSQDGAEVAAAALSGGAASFTRTGLAPGEHTFTARYDPDDTEHADSGSDALTLVVPDPEPEAVGTTTALTGTLGGTASDRADLTVTVTPDDDSAGTPSGFATLFHDGTEVEATVLTGGTATFTRTGLAPGEHTFTARYDPDDADHTGSTSATLILVVPDPEPEAVGTTTTVASTVSGRDADLEVTVSPDEGTTDPTGTVTITVDGATVATRDLTAGGATHTVTGLAPGEHSVVASYTPDDGDAFTGSTSATETLVVDPVATTTSLTGALTGDPADGTARLQVGVGSDPDLGSPTGSYVLLDGADQVDAGTLVEGTAVIDLSGLAPGAHTFTARYTAGGTTWADSVSEPVTLVVEEDEVEPQPVGTTTTVSGPRSIKHGKRPKVRVSVRTDDGDPATGAVRAKVKAVKGATRTWVRTLSLRDGERAKKLPRFKRGKVRVIVVYRGEGLQKKSRATITVKVTKAGRR